MSLIYDIELFKESMDFCFRKYLELSEEHNKHLVYKILNQSFGNKVSNFKVVFDKEVLEDMFFKLNNSFNQDELIYCTSNEYEVLIDELSDRYYMRDPLMGIDKYNISDENITITIQEASEVFYLFLLMNTYTTYKNEKTSIMRPLSLRRLFMDYENGAPAENLYDEREINGLMLIKDSRRLSVKIISQTAINKEKYKDYQYSYLFNLALNYRLHYVQTKKCEYRYVRIIDQNRRNSRSRTNFEMDIPRRKYNRELINYYQMAMSSDNLLVKYLSLYHILEYFYENFYYEDLIKIVKDAISKPQFSLKDNGSVKSFIKDFEKRVGDRKGDRIVFNEHYALNLTLGKFLDLEELESKINEQDSSLITYYKNTKCGFSAAKKINFTDINTIASRLYKNRNALVHSKDTDKEKYIPFKDEEILEREIPLIKIIAETIIINSSELL